MQIFQLVRHVKSRSQFPLHKIYNTVIILKILAQLNSNIMKGFPELIHIESFQTDPLRFYPYVQVLGLSNLNPNR